MDEFLTINDTLESCKKIIKKINKTKDEISRLNPDYF